MTGPSASRPPLDRSRLGGPVGNTVGNAVGQGVERGPGFLVEVVDEAGSTNAVVAERARAGAPPGLVVVAEHQTAGRGRLDRRWETPARAALTLSVLVRPTREATAWPWLPLLTGVAVARSLRDHGVTADLKWPNDVLLDGRKVAGILVERVDTPAGPTAVLGIGVNVSTTADELPESPPGAPAPTSLALAGGSAAPAVDRTDLLLGLLDRLRAQYDAWAEPGGDAGLRATYTSLCVTAHDRPVRIALPSGEVLAGVARGVGEDGGLRVDTATGPVTVSAGDVLHVRAGEH